MAGNPSKRSPWALRLGILGALLLLGSGIAFYSQTSAIDSIYDPRERATVEIGVGDSAIFEVGNNECYMAVAFENASDSTVEVKKMVGVAAVNEAMETKNCFTDWTPMASDGASFVVVEQWVTEEPGELMVSVSCEENDCGNEVVWIVNVDGWQMEVFESSGLTIGFSLCCIGLIVLPIAAIFAYSSRSRAVRGTLNVIGRDQEFLQALQEQDQSMVAQHPMLQRLKEDLERQQIEEMQGEQEPQDDSFVDGSKAVMQGQLLTTEQVYAFMRGDIEEMSRPVEDPFVDSAPKVQEKRIVPKKVNTEQISVWDTGGDGAAPSKEPTAARRKSVPRENKVSSKEWAEWDDM